MKPTVMKYGLMSGALVSLMMALSMLLLHDQIGFDITGMVVGYATMVLAFLLIYFGVRSYRDTVGGGTVRFGRALVVGLLIAAVSSACYVATWEIVYYKFMPDFMDKYAAHELAKERANGVTEEQFALKKAEMDKNVAMYKNPLYNVAFTFMEPLPVGLLIALISAGILSRSRKREENDNVLTARAG